MRKSLFGVAAGIMALAAVAAVSASDFGPQPINYEETTHDYLESRLTNKRGARIVFDSEPYQVIADFGDGVSASAWAVDIRVRARLQSRSYGGYMPYTVIFVDGEPVAFSEDIVSVERVERTIVASRD
ncbi:MAG: hypothetical protein AAGD92_14955 [Pseudomonadota bacterium]